MRPRGSFGAAALALTSAAAQAPGTVRDIAARGQVDPHVARYTVSRLVSRGELAALNTGRPTVLAPAAAGASARAPFGQLAHITTSWVHPP